MKSNALRVSTILLALIVLTAPVPAWATPLNPAASTALIQQEIVALFYQTSAIASASGFNPGERTSLVVKLLEARSAVVRGNDEAAANLLGAFINEINALQQSGRLSATDAATLSNQASLIITQLGS